MVNKRGVYGGGGTPSGILGVPRSRRDLMVEIRGVYGPDGGVGTPCD